MITLEKLDIPQALLYMGHKGEPSDTLLKLVSDCEKLVLDAIKPSYVYREAVLIKNSENICIENSPLCLVGKDIAHHLENCDKAVIFAATLSSSADSLIRRLEAEDMSMALTADALCSAAIEQVCDFAEKEIFSELNCGFHTWRFSAGYGDLPLSLQKELTDYLNAQRRIGLTVTDNYLMIPRKSVTAIIGVSDNRIDTQPGGCAVCSMRDRCGISKLGGCGFARKSKT